MNNKVYIYLTDLFTPVKRFASDENIILRSKDRDVTNKGKNVINENQPVSRQITLRDHFFFFSREKFFEFNSTAPLEYSKLLFAITPFIFPVASYHLHSSEMPFVWTCSCRPNVRVLCIMDRQNLMVVEFGNRFAQKFYCFGFSFPHEFATHPFAASPSLTPSYTLQMSTYTTDSHTTITQKDAFVVQLYVFYPCRPVLWPYAREVLVYEVSVYSVRKDDGVIARKSRNEMAYSCLVAYYWSSISWAGGKQRERRNAILIKFAAQRQMQ